MNMSMEYPCIYFEKDGKCRKFSDNTAISYCVMGPCPEQKLSNADHIRAMSDDELSEQFVVAVNGLQPCTLYYSIPTERTFLTEAEAVRVTLEWLQQPAKENT